MTDAEPIAVAALLTRSSMSETAEEIIRVDTLQKNFLTEMREQLKQELREQIAQDLIHHANMFHNGLVDPITLEIVRGTRGQ